MTFILSLVMTYRKPLNIELKTRDGIIVVASFWIIMCFIGAIPVYLNREVPTLMDAFFEMTSGFTTTGSSVLSDISELSHATLFWRSFSHFIGGLGILVFTIAVLPSGNSDINLMRAEVPGPTFGKLVSRLRDSAIILYIIYTVMTVVLLILLMVVGVNFFDAMLLAFGTAGTGGFSVNPDGLAAYTNPKAVEWIIAVAMVLFGINFNIYYYFLLGKAKEVFKFDEELRYYLLLIIGTTAIIAINVSRYYTELEPLLRETFFTVSSIMTTTGYSVTYFEVWPLFSHMLIIGLMFIGGMAGSTAGGLKVSRVIIYLKSAVALLRKTVQPRRVNIPTFNGKAIDTDTILSVMNYLLIYVLIFIVLMISVSLETHDFETAVSTAAATFNNIGPGLGSVGPTGDFGFFSNWNKLILSLGMIAGRLEILPMVILLSPSTVRYMRKGY